MPDITYCAQEHCPFEDCERHMHNLEGKTGLFSMAYFDRMCNRFLEWLEVKGDG